MRAPAARLGLKEYLQFVAPLIVDDSAPPRWPPDAFAVTASMLRRAAAYSAIIEKWPPLGGPAKWTEFIRRIGNEWRAAATGRSAVPSIVDRWWRIIRSAGPLPIERVCQYPHLCEAVLQLNAAADEASRGIGILDPKNVDRFEAHAIDILARNRFVSVCDRIHPSRAIVLPKLHTPRSGLTLRSLSHHLALCGPSEVRPEWSWMPYTTHEWRFNILLLPWPEIVLPSQFWPSQGNLRNMPPNFGLFSCNARRNRSIPVDRLRRVVARAESIVGKIDAVILPELALRGREHIEICRQTGAIVVGGIGEAAQGGRSGRNAVAVAVPVGQEVVSWTQEKHHRWRIDGAQIAQYGLGAELDPEMEWWEHVRSAPRQLRFWQFNGWLTMCVLICEDLARQDPVTELVRAVGPNLVVCLLMDGPQLDVRWPARYATVLADDPGSSVLTLTSLGMAMLSRPYGKPVSRVIGLWKDALSGRTVEISLGLGAAGVVLSLTRTYRKEWTADGRDDGGATGYLCLNGMREIEA